MAPALEAPADAVPPELDVVLRVDVGRVRGALGPVAIAAIRKELEDGDPLNRFILDALERTDVFVAAGRFEANGIKDSVVAAEGDYRDLDPRKYAVAPAWQKAIDLGGDVRRYDRAKPKKRSDFARVYVRSNRLLVLVTEGAIDSVEAVVEKRAPPNTTSPPERGLISAAVRLRPGNELLAGKNRFPMVADAFGGARSFEVWIDQTSNGFSMFASFEFDSDADAATASHTLETLRVAVAEKETRAAAFARHGSVESQGRHVVARVNLPAAVFGQTLEGAFR